jgi:hypothetical protein
MAITEGRIILIKVRNVLTNLGIQVCLEYWVENLQAMWVTITRHPTSQPSTGRLMRSSFDEKRGIPISRFGSWNGWWGYTEESGLRNNVRHEVI